MAQFVSDSFTGTSGTLLTTYSANWVKHPNSGANTLAISDQNRLRSNAVADDSTYYHSSSPANENYSVSADFICLSATATQPTVIGRTSTSVRTFYMAQFSNTAKTWLLYKVVAGTFTQLSSSVSDTGFTAGVTRAAKLLMNGTAISCWKDGVSIISATDSAITAAGKAGVRILSNETDSTGFHIDNFSADDVVSALALSGEAASSAVATGGITSTIGIVGAAISGSSATGAVTSSIPLAGSSASVSVANGDVSLSITLSGSATSSVIASGGIGMVIPIGGAAQSVAYATGELDGGAGLSGAAASASSASANLTLAITLSGSALGAALASAGISSVIPIEGTAQSISTMAGDLTSLAEGALAGSAQSYSSSTGQVNIDIPVEGNASAYATGSGNVSAIMPIAGSSASVVTATGDLVIESAFNLSGNVLAQVLASGSINMTMPMSGSALAQALAIAALTDSSIIIRGNIMNIYCSMPLNKVSLALPSRKLMLEQN